MSLWIIKLIGLRLCNGQFMFVYKLFYPVQNPQYNVPSSFSYYTNVSPVIQNSHVSNPIGTHQVYLTHNYSSNVHPNSYVKVHFLAGSNIPVTTFAIVQDSSWFMDSGATDYVTLTLACNYFSPKMSMGRVKPTLTQPIGLMG